MDKMKFWHPLGLFNFFMRYQQATQLLNRFTIAQAILQLRLFYAQILHFLTQYWLLIQFILHAYTTIYYLFIKRSITSFHWQIIELFNFFHQILVPFSNKNLAISTLFSVWLIDFSTFYFQTHKTSIIFFSFTIILFLLISSKLITLLHYIVIHITLHYIHLSRIYQLIILPIVIIIFLLTFRP